MTLEDFKKLITHLEAVSNSKFYLSAIDKAYGCIKEGMLIEAFREIYLSKMNPTFFVVMGASDLSTPFYLLIKKYLNDEKLPSWRETVDIIRKSGPPLVGGSASLILTLSLYNLLTGTMATAFSLVPPSMFMVVFFFLFLEKMSTATGYDSSIINRNVEEALKNNFDSIKQKHGTEYEYDKNLYRKINMNMHSASQFKNWTQSIGHFVQFASVITGLILKINWTVLMGVFATGWNLFTSVAADIWQLHKNQKALSAGVNDLNNPLLQTANMDTFLQIGNEKLAPKFTGTIGSQYDKPDTYLSFENENNAETLQKVQDKYIQISEKYRNGEMHMLGDIV